MPHERRDDPPTTTGRRRAFRIAYDGRPFHGFQRQPTVPTVEDAILDALVALDVVEEGDGHTRPTPPGYAAAGRTDAGVSALAQTVAFDAPAWLDPPALNARLPDGVRAWAHATVPASFHATHDATGRAYRYHLSTPPAAADCDRARRAIDRFVGRHDFAALTADDGDTTRRLRRGTVERDGRYLVVTVEAPGFLRQQVRRLVTVLDAVARGGPLDRLDRVLDPAVAPEGIEPAPPEPLCLVDVAYPDVAFERAEDVTPAATFGRGAIRARTRSRVLDGIAEGIGTDADEGAD
ncbi:tRNA pseudouridine(38-40) synthase TruA [Halobacteriales archaeon SW_7_68_16]|nr:MAG: tRNA pseudouridine(38-40) synthase TruA [Halobacteriales archaeon SW_7_68_16]